MSNTYTQIHIQTIFAVQNRSCLIGNKWQEELYKYMTGIIQNHQHKVLAIGGISDHIHIFIGMRPTQSISDLMQDVKGNSSKWINEKGFLQGHFSWQTGYGAFSYSRSHVSKVIDYINNQAEHHHKVTFIEEYISLLKKFEVSYNSEYLFKPID